MGTGAHATQRRLVVVGNGMVSHKLLELLAARGAHDSWDVVAFGDERRPAYDRVHLSSFFDGGSADGLLLGDVDGATIHTGEEVVAVDRDRATVRTNLGREVRYDALVLATGSVPFVPPVPGKDAEGCFVYRTIDDLESIAAFAAGCRTGAVVGGGLLGLEAANALLQLGLETHVVEFAPRLMPVQVDDVGGAVLRRHVEALGVAIHTGCQTTQIVVGDRGQVSGMAFADGEQVEVDLVVFSAGIRPRDSLAAAAGLEIGERGGVVVDERCQTGDPRIFAIGECAHVAGRTWGLVAPGYQMARVVADRLCGGDATFGGSDLSTKLKLLGVEVASFGDAFGAGDEASEDVSFHDPIAGVYRRLVVDAASRQIIGGILVGDASQYDALASMARGDLSTPADIAPLAAPVGAAGAAAPMGVEALAGGASICSCNGITKDDICGAIATNELRDPGSVKKCTGAGTGCGGCMPMVTQLLGIELANAGIEVPNHLCEHFAYSRQDLFDLIRVESITSFAELLERHGQGLGCEICKPAVASILASTGNGYILDGEQAALQDTNDHFLANLQRDGTYSVVPRVPGGEITPDQLITLGQVAKDFGLYTKITGGQRIDLFGARVEQLPAIWGRLIDVGMESGHAYGKALRTVKSCVGRTWCRYGVQDSTGMAVQLELRYRGLRAPHKLKLAVSGCVRECAEAQGKDVGVIATEKGWNLFVAGNGGARPQHAVLFATDIDDEALVRYIDRFLMYYIRTADRLERTATWFNKLDGGLEQLRRVIVDDALGICDQLDAEMARHVDTYQCEWKATLESPERLARFRTFVNSDEPDPTIVFVSERGQPRPVREDERALL
ncbi:MAG: nitrite reductase large subunit [Acidobacteria bacterium]|nr:nitrite reductase large subunit [Acidobacteriota bacterium]